MTHYMKWKLSPHYKALRYIEKQPTTKRPPRSPLWDQEEREREREQQINAYIKLFLGFCNAVSLPFCLHIHPISIFRERKCCYCLLLDYFFQFFSSGFSRFIAWKRELQGAGFLLSGPSLTVGKFGFSFNGWRYRRWELEKFLQL